MPADDQALANTIATSTKPAGKGWKTVSFAPTLPLPTYLVAYAAGPWDVVDVPAMPATPQRPTSTPLRGIAAQGQGPRITPALDQTPAIIAALEDYYAFGYPFDKLDLVAAPDFSAGAMENPGFVTFRDWLLLLDKDSPAENVQRSFNTNAHELAHQWTGDTVTMAWWDDLWLNEAFATWMQQKITMQLHRNTAPIWIASAVRSTRWITTAWSAHARSASRSPAMATSKPPSTASPTRRARRCWRCSKASSARTCSARACAPTSPSTSSAAPPPMTWSMRSQKPPARAKISRPRSAAS